MHLSPRCDRAGTPSCEFYSIFIFCVTLKVYTYGWGGTGLLMMRTSDSTEAEMVYVLRKHWCNQKDTGSQQEAGLCSTVTSKVVYASKPHFVHKRSRTESRQPSPNDILNINFLSPNEAELPSACPSLLIAAGQPRKSQALIEPHQTGCACDN